MQPLYKSKNSRQEDNTDKNIMKQDEFFQLNDEKKDEMFNFFTNSLSKSKQKLAIAAANEYSTDELAEMRNARDWGSLIYTEDAANFYLTNRSEINDLAKELAGELCEDGIISLVRNFACYKDDKPTEKNVAIAAFSPRRGKKDCDVQSIRETLSFFAIEEIANDFQNFIYDNQ